jgi:hypothetical protein
MTKPQSKDHPWAKLTEPKAPPRVEAFGWRVAVPRAVGVYTQNFKAETPTRFDRIVANVRREVGGVLLESISIAGRSELAGELAFGAISAEDGATLSSFLLSTLAAGDVMTVTVRVKETPEAYELLKIGVINLSHLAYGLGKKEHDEYVAFFEGCKVLKDEERSSQCQ